MLIFNRFFNISILKFPKANRTYFIYTINIIKFFYHILNKNFSTSKNNYYHKKLKFINILNSVFIMSGTKIDNLRVTKVVDGDTINIEINGQEEVLRLICVDTEESRNIRPDKPKTELGIRASEIAKEYFDIENNNDVRVEIEFDTNDPVEICLKKHRGNFGRLLCYVHKNGENYNLRLVKDGWSPYFDKYGRSRLYDREFTENEVISQAKDLNIWNTSENEAGHTRGNYTQLKNWWYTRALAVEDYRKNGIPANVLSVRLDYEQIVQASENEEDIVVFCDLQNGINIWTGGGAVIWAGSIFHKFNLWIPDIDSDESKKIINLINKRYSNGGKGYVYVKGKAEQYNNKPQIVLKSIDQLSDFPT